MATSLAMAWTAATALRDRMNATDKVQLVGPGDTDLVFSIKDIPAVPCCGTHNIPDGECFTSPVRDSVHGVIHFNTPTIYNGISFKNIRLTFRDGQVVEATADQNGAMPATSASSVRVAAAFVRK